MTKLAVLASLALADERFYINVDHIDRRAIQVFRDFLDRDVFCSGYSSAPCEEPEMDETLCGSNDWTYTSICKFKQEYCMGNVGLRFNYWGECTSEEEEEEEMANDNCLMMPCMRDWRPVCGTNGVTYSNYCEFENASRCDSSIELSGHGECEEACDPSPSCPKSYQPMCGSDGVTYSNLCEFNGAVCAKQITLKKRGSCNAMSNDVFGDRVTMPCPRCPLFQDQRIELKIKNIRDLAIRYARQSLETGSHVSTSMWH